MVVAALLGSGLAAVLKGFGDLPCRLGAGMAGFGGTVCPAGGVDQPSDLTPAPTTGPIGEPTNGQTVGPSSTSQTTGACPVQDGTSTASPSTTASSEASSDPSADPSVCPTT